MHGKYLGDVRFCSLDSPVLAYAPILVGLSALKIAFGKMFDSALKAIGLFVACPLSSVTHVTYRARAVKAYEGRLASALEYTGYATVKTEVALSSQLC